MRAWTCLLACRRAPHEMKQQDRRNAERNGSDRCKLRDSVSCRHSGDACEYQEAAVAFLVTAAD